MAEEGGGERRELKRPFLRRLRRLLAPAQTCSVLAVLSVVAAVQRRRIPHAVAVFIREAPILSQKHSISISRFVNLGSS